MVRVELLQVGSSDGGRGDGNISPLRSVASNPRMSSKPHLKLGRGEQRDAKVREDVNTKSQEGKHASEHPRRVNARRQDLIEARDVGGESHDPENP